MVLETSTVEVSIRLQKVVRTLLLEQKGDEIILNVIQRYVLHVRETVLRELMSLIALQVATIYSLLYFSKPLHIFRVVIPPIIRSTYNCNYSIWNSSNRLCYLLLS
jgi:hypothetical protein